MKAFFDIRGNRWPGRWVTGLAVCLLFPAVAQAGDRELLLERPPALERLVPREDGGLRPLALDEPPRTAGELIMISRHFRVPEANAEDNGDGGGLQLTLPVPEFLDYLPGTAVGPGARVLVSLDGGQSFEPDPGVQGRLPAPATHLRWMFTRDMGPGVRGQVRYRGLSRGTADTGENNRQPPR